MSTAADEPATAEETAMTTMRRAFAGLMIFGCLGWTSIATVERAAAAPIEVPPVPSNLAVPAGHSVFFHGRAVGTQNYMCLPQGSGVAWTLLGPQATLFQTFLGNPYQVATHFLSDNPDETDTLRPTWQHSFDTSRVWGKVRAMSSDPAFVEAGAIPWLLLEKVGTEPGPAGGSLLTRTTFIHRVNTSGGVAPSTGCSEPGNTGDLALVPYVTDYFFYRAARER
jgi:Protein of unknown function (DUF3455)